MLAGGDIDWIYHFSMYVQHSFPLLGHVNREGGKSAEICLLKDNLEALAVLLTAHQAPITRRCLLVAKRVKTASSRCQWMWVEGQIRDFGSQYFLRFANAWIVLGYLEQAQFLQSFATLRRTKFIVAGLPLVLNLSSCCVIVFLCAGSAWDIGKSKGKKEISVVRRGSRKIIEFSLIQLGGRRELPIAFPTRLSDKKTWLSIKHQTDGGGRKRKSNLNWDVFRWSWLARSRVGFPDKT